MDLIKNEIAKHITDIHHLAEKAIPDLRNEIKHIIQTQSTNETLYLFLELSQDHSLISVRTTLSSQDG